MAENIHDFESIERNIREWTERNVSPDFEFRQGQFEAIRGIVYSIINNRLDTNILQAPTGTGKSFICIIAAGVLAKYYDRKCYILASDLYLWRQYQEAIDKYRIRDFGYMKGSLGNYYCSYSNCGYEDGECKRKRVSLSKFRHNDPDTVNKWPCSQYCQYMLDRFKAEKTPVTLMTYQLWLYQMNLVKNENGEGFTRRDVIFCDECHNIPDIISRFAQPQVTPRDTDRILAIAEYALRHNIELPWVPEFLTSEARRKFAKYGAETFKEQHIHAKNNLDVSRIMKAFRYINGCIELAYRNDPVPTPRRQLKIEVLSEFVRLLESFNRLAEAAADHNKKQNGAEKSSPKTAHDIRAARREFRKTERTPEEIEEFERGLGGETSGGAGEIHELSIFKTLNWYHNHFSSFAQYAKAVREAGKEYVVMERTEDDNKEPTYTFFCVKEDYLCRTYLLANADHKVMTSATIGNIHAFMTNIGIELERIPDNPSYVAYSALPNIFDFSQSPIYYCPNYRMSFRDKNYSFPKIQDMIYRLLEMYPDVRGMINTGSYVNSRAIINNAPEHLRDRLIGYDNARNKNHQVDNFKSRRNGVLVGPTLVEGVDLPGDMCRLIIIVKLPYPNLTSPQTKAKMNLFPLWYESTTSNTVIQNIGRGVRFDGDWCHTYILDGCFDGLYMKTYTQYAPEIQNRIVRIAPEAIMAASGTSDKYER